MQHSRTAGYLTLATGLHFVSVGTNRVPPAPSTAKWTCKHVRLARCSREGQKKDLEKAEHFPALNLPSLVISDNTRCFHHCVDTIAALLLTTPCGIFSDVPFYSIIPAPICQCFFKGRKRGQTRADGEIQNPCSLRRSDKAREAVRGRAREDCPVVLMLCARPADSIPGFVRPQSQALDF